MQKAVGMEASWRVAFGVAGLIGSACQFRAADSGLWLKIHKISSIARSHPLKT